MKLFATEHPFTTGRDISSAAFWAKPLIERDETFAWLRKNAPVSFHPPTDENPMSPPDHGEAGFWALTRAEDINYASHHHELFSSNIGGILVRPVDTINRTGAPMILNMDPPDHTLYRKIVSSAFTPRGIARMDAKIHERAEAIVDAVVGVGKFDFVEAVSAKLPMLTVADMVGVPDSQLAAFTEAGDAFAIASSPELDLPEGMTAMEMVLGALSALHEIGNDLVAYRRKHPGDDIATALAQAEVHGRPISEAEVTSIMVLLSAAGNDTTKHTTSWTALSLFRDPAQKAWLRDDYDARIGASIEEFIRYATVVLSFARTAIQDTEIGGQQIAAGDKVALFYCSGNRDESLFPDPHRFDLTRPRVNHVAFGGRGVHFCMGNGVARTQLRAIFKQILDKLPNYEIIGEPDLLPNDQFNSIRKLSANSN
jgi:cytochrome P450